MMCAAEASTRSQFVDAGLVLQVQRIHALTKRRVSAVVDVRQDQEREKTSFMEWRVQQLSNFVQREDVVLLRKAPQHREPNAKKAITLAVFARAGLEKTLKKE